MSESQLALRAANHARKSVPRALLRPSGAVSLLSLAGAFFAIACAISIGAEYNPRSPLLLVVSQAVLAVLLALSTATWVAGGRLGAWAPALTVAFCGAFAGGILAAALHGSVYPPGGLNWDVGFRVEAVARFTATSGLVDMTYHGLPAFYPPLMPWTVGRAAALFDLAPYSAWKHASIVVAFAVPLLSYLLWRRLVGAALAAFVALAALVVPNIDQPEAWLSLFVVVPWWLEAIYGLRRPEVRALPVWAYGLIGAALFCTYYYFFFILALALALLPVLDRLHPPLDLRPWRRRLGVLGIAAVFAAVYWLPLLLSILEVREPASMQNLYFKRDHTELAVDVFDGSAVGFLMLGGLVNLAWTFRRHRLSAGLLLLVAAGYAWYVLGFFLAAAGKPVLAFRAEPFVELVLIVAGVRASLGVTRTAAIRGRRDVVRVAALVGAALIFVIGQEYVGTVYESVRRSHSTPRPDGTLQRYAPASAEAPDVSAAQVIDLVQRLHGGEDPPVVLSPRSDVVKISSLYAFNPWHAIYAHPAGEFPARVEFTKRLASERDPRRFAALARHNRFEPIDVFALKSSGDDQLLYELWTFKFPYGHRRIKVRFTRDQFSDKWWSVRDVGTQFIAASR